jgi:hypothetical protein
MEDIDNLMKKVKGIKIKPCPFCGKQPNFELTENRIYCPHVGQCAAPSTGSYGKWSDLIKQWNMRA